MRKTYSIVVEYLGYDYKYDRQIEKAVGRECIGSGYGMGGRDISFAFAQEGAVKRAVARVRKQCRRMHTKVNVIELCADCYNYIGECECEVNE